MEPAGLSDPSHDDVIEFAQQVKTDKRITSIVPKFDVPFFQAGLAGYSDGAMRLIARRNGCPYCTQIKQVLEGKGYNYQEYKLGVDFQREAFYNQFGQGSTFPQVTLNSTNLGGCTDTVRYLKEQNLI